ncbi:hypothetical protein BN1058_00063 [Paraliobacillus sp. PM-2]|uniref:hypothetical protein n=1 Tax=Paraliobacillus sp. PM-2 TaxID=1462524 RepID=UPI00061BAA69|nr:hypothetical protein [Paraliobacillus sp. PM-2]CQR45824.1 hypothetical protein BN1058_00063 [Paraliobacillus sp. PM-2]
MKRLIWLLAVTFIIACFYFAYSAYKQHQRYETYISSQIMQSLGSVVGTMGHESKLSDQALSTILERKSLSLKQLNNINSVVNFYMQKLQVTREVANHFGMETNQDLHEYILSCRQKLFEYQRQFERNELTKLELNTNELQFFKQLKDNTAKWESVIVKYKDIPETERYEVSEGHWISLYNDLSNATQHTTIE